MTSSGNNNELTALFNVLCNISNESKFEQAAKDVVHLMKAALGSQLDQERVGKPFIMPYKDLTDLVFYQQRNLPPSEVLANFRNLVMASILADNYCTKDTTDSQKEERKNHFISCYDKIINHIQLAQIQRDYIQQITKAAEQAAEQAEKTAADAQKTAKSAEDTAQKATEVAEKAESTYNTMFANYVTILGVFTAIIVTIFGGLNVVDTIVSYGDTHFSTIVFLAALVLMCVVCLLYFLAKIILRLNGKDEANQRFTLESLFGVIFSICLTLALIAWCVNLDKETPEQPKETSEQTK